MLFYLSDKQDRVRFDGLADHQVSEAIYIRDPDFNGIEIYIDRPKSEWKWTVKNSMRQLQMATLPLNTKDLLQQSTDRGWTGMPKDTIIGHVHLHVSNLLKAMKFYHEILGMNLTTTYPEVELFCPAGRYHHHIATNTWLETTNIPPASPESIGLNHFGIEWTKYRQRQVAARSRAGFPARFCNAASMSARSPSDRRSWISASESRPGYLRRSSRCRDRGFGFQTAAPR